MEIRRLTHKDVVPAGSTEAYEARVVPFVESNVRPINISQRLKEELNKINDSKIERQEHYRTVRNWTLSAFLAIGVSLALVQACGPEIKGSVNAQVERNDGGTTYQPTIYFNNNR